MPKKINNVLVTHALKNVWASPSQDLQYILQPKRITRKEGNYNYVKIVTDVYDLPKKGIKFHVFQVGQYYPSLLNIINNQESIWVKASESVNKNSVLINLYNIKGIQYPNEKVWIQVTSNKNLLIAVEESKTIPIQLGYEVIYFRVYSNMFFRTIYANEDYHKLASRYFKINSDNDKALARMAYKEYSSNPGKILVNINGFMQDTLKISDMNINDDVEVTFDGSVYKVVELSLKDLAGFDSIFDSVRKFVIHYPGKQNFIDYHDDIDFYIKNTKNNKTKMVYYHRNNENAVRQITHKDYTVVCNYVYQYRNAFPTWEDHDDFKIVLCVKYSGFIRELVYENNRLKELYKMSDDDIYAALIGLESNVTNWRADYLEGCDLNKIMSHTNYCIDNLTVANAYGYNATSKLIGDTPNKLTVQSHLLTTTIPSGLQKARTVYEYDNTGTLIGKREGNIAHNGDVYSSLLPNSHFIETLSGVGSDLLYDNYGKHSITLDSDSSYRMYITEFDKDGEITNNWRDVTDSNLYTIVNGVLTWNVDHSKFLTAVRSDFFFLSQTFKSTFSNGNLIFRLVCKQEYKNNIVLENMRIPFGELDVFLNGKSLIKDINYLMDFPLFTITDKKHVIGDPKIDEQEITIRFKGHCSRDLKLEPLLETNFIKYGLMSRNSYYNLRDDRVQRIVVDGRVMLKEQLKFSEDDSAVLIPNAENGLPYSVRDIIVPVRNFLEEDTYSYREKSRAIDKMIQDYLTVKIPEPAIDNPNVILKLYELYSPFLNAIIHDLEHGQLRDERIYTNYNNDILEDMLANYLFLLKMDPTQTPNYPDPKYTIIHPHNKNYVVKLNHFDYRFVKSINDFYCQGRTNLNNFVTIG